MVRDLAARTADARHLLETEVDVWVATAADDAPHLVPVSLAWLGERVVIAVAHTSVTATNLRDTGRARLSVGHTRDVVMIDASLERWTPVEDDPELAAAYVDRSDWDPRRDTGYDLMVLRPTRIQAWREADEISGRTIMREGRWLTTPLVG